MKVAEDRECNVRNVVMFFANGEHDYSIFKKAILLNKRSYCEVCVSLPPFQDNYKMISRLGYASHPTGLTFIGATIKTILVKNLYPESCLTIYVDREHIINVDISESLRGRGINCEIVRNNNNKILELSCGVSNQSRHFYIIVLGNKFCLEDEILSYLGANDDNADSCENYKSIYRRRKSQIEENDKIYYELFKNLIEPVLCNKSTPQ